MNVQIFSFKLRQLIEIQLTGPGNEQEFKQKVNLLKS